MLIYVEQMAKGNFVIYVTKMFLPILIFALLRKLYKLLTPKYIKHIDFSDQTRSS